MGKKFVFGVSAKKQGGKSTFLGMLGPKMGDVQVIRMADELKRTVINCFTPWEWKLTIEDLESDETKNRMLPCGRTIRQVLQVVGTDWFRSLWEDCWINAWKRRVSETDADVVLVPDVRFPNELRAVQEMGGFVIRLMRAPFGDQDQHESETALDQVEYDSLYVMDDSVGCSMLNFDYVYDNRDKTLEDTRVWMNDTFLPHLREWLNMRGIKIHKMKGKIC
jgi:hypothetical protein